jgi:hypothetical protein
MTVTGQETVQDIETVSGTGLYSVVTNKVMHCYPSSPPSSFLLSSSRSLSLSLFFLSFLIIPSYMLQTFSFLSPLSTLLSVSPPSVFPHILFCASLHTLHLSSSSVLCIPTPLFLFCSVYPYTSLPLLFCASLHLSSSSVLCIPTPLFLFLFCSVHPYTSLPLLFCASLHLSSSSVLCIPTPLFLFLFWSAHPSVPFPTSIHKIN